MLLRHFFHNRTITVTGCDDIVTFFCNKFLQRLLDPVFRYIIFRHTFDLIPVYFHDMVSGFDKIFRIRRDLITNKNKSDFQMFLFRPRDTMHTNCQNTHDQGSNNT